MRNSITNNFYYFLYSVSGLLSGKIEEIAKNNSDGDNESSALMPIRKNTINIVKDIDEYINGNEKWNAKKIHVSI